MAPDTLAAQFQFEGLTALARRLAQGFPGQHRVQALGPAAHHRQ